MAQLHRRPLVGGNWKMNTTLPTASDLADQIVRALFDETTVDVVLCPPFPNLEAIYRTIEASPLQLGAQDLYWEDSGAFTGEVSGAMLAAVGCDWVIAGHSERRHLFGEGNDVVNRKVHAALRNDLNVILAVGETREERGAGRTEAVLEEQIRGSLAGVGAADMERIAVAYEPVWAIGTGDTATPDQAREAHTFVRRVLREILGEEVAGATRIVYGGSVTASNAADLMAQPGIDGALVGGASLKAADFTAIVRAAHGH